MKLSSKNLSGLVALVLVVGSVVLPMIVPENNKMKKLFTDNVNLSLVIAIVALVSYLDLQVGIASLFLVLVMAVKYRNNLLEGFQNNDSKQEKLDQIQNLLNELKEDGGEPINPEDDGEPVNSEENVSEETTSEMVDMQMNDSEMVDDGEPSMENSSSSDVVEEFPRSSVPVHQQHESENNVESETLEGFTSSKLPEGELLTQEYPNGTNVYDVAGCRYDSNNKPLNATMYGPPLGDCRIYAPNGVQQTGTVFYPLNG